MPSWREASKRQNAPFLMALIPNLEEKCRGQSKIFLNIKGYLEGGTRVPQFFFTQLIDFVSSRDFSLEDLGLGSLQGVDDVFDAWVKKQFKLDPTFAEGEKRVLLRCLYEATVSCHV